MIIDFFGEFVVTFVTKRRTNNHEMGKPVYLLDRGLAEKVCTVVV